MVCLLCASAFAAKKDDLYKQAMAASGAGRVAEAAGLFCQVAKEDSSYKDAQQMCAVMTQEAEKELKRYEDRYQEGVKAFESGNFDDAEQKLKNVRGGPRLDAARQLLGRIPAARAARAGEETENAMNARHDQAVQAYQRNDFAGARNLFNQISGRREGDAKNYLNRILKYEQAMSEGDNLAGSKNFKGALSAYNDAATIKSDGPGDPRGKAQRMETSLAAASQPVPAPTTTSGPPPSTTAAAPPSRPPVTTTTTPAAPLRVVTEAVKAPAQPAVDVARLKREAEAAKVHGDIATAKGKYIAILTAEPNNREVRLALETLPQESGPQQQQASSEADVMLAKAIREFYQGSYQDAEVHIRDYLAFNGGKVGLSHFFLGATKLTRFYLNGERADERKLLAEAQASFRLAKQASGFKPPDETYISPKILKTYEDVTP
ncbi:MAG: hypothetical protein ACRD2R_09045 [Terriglobales bacterium]